MTITTYQYILGKIINHSYNKEYAGSFDEYINRAGIRVVDTK